MNSENRQKTEVDNAWKKLHSRLEKENLIDGPQPVTSHFLLYKVIAGIAAILIAGWFIGVIITLKPTEDSSTEDLYTLQNEIRNSTLIKTLHDGSTVYLAENTELIYPEHFSKEKREVRLKGDAYFEVTGNKAHPFLIYTNHTEIEVIGTSFEIRNPDKERMELSVLTGEVKVSFIPSKGEKQTEQSVRYVRGGESIILTSRGEWNYLQETKSNLLESKRFRFKNEQVKNIIEVMNKNSKQEEVISIISSLAHERLTVDFSNQTLEEIAEILSLAVGGNWTRENHMLCISD